MIRFAILSTLFTLTSFNIAWNQSSDVANWRRVEHEYYTLKVPAEMDRMEDLNDEASSEYGMVRESNGEVLELYMIVLYETHEEIAAYNLNMEFDPLSYWKVGAESLVSSLGKHKYLTKKMVVETVNKLSMTRGNIWGKMGRLEVNYHYAVFEGKNAFYQVLCWTLSDQYERFKYDMETIVNTFNEKKLN